MMKVGLIYFLNGVYNKESSSLTLQKVGSTNKQFEIMDEYSLLSIMSAIIYSNLSQSSKDNGYGIINAVGQARELLNEVNKQTK